MLDSLAGSSKGPEAQASPASSAVTAHVHREEPPGAEGHAPDEPMDWTHAEIAELLGVTEKAVERMLANERARLRKRGIA